jgi:hypothetical protein
VNWLEAKLKSTGQWNTFLNHYATADARDDYRRQAWVLHRHREAG